MIAVFVGRPQSIRSISTKMCLQPFYNLAVHCIPFLHTDILHPIHNALLLRSPQPPTRLRHPPLAHHLPVHPPPIAPDPVVVPPGNVAGGRSVCRRSVCDGSPCLCGPLRTVPGLDVDPGDGSTSQRSRVRLTHTSDTRLVTRITCPRRQ